jgi:hypothetical protein
MILGHPITWEEYFLVKFGFALVLVALLIMLVVIGVFYAVVKAAWTEARSGKDNEPRAGKTLGL